MCWFCFWQYRYVSAHRRADPAAKPMSNMQITDILHGANKGYMWKSVVPTAYSRAGVRNFASAAGEGAQQQARVLCLTLHDHKLYNSPGHWPGKPAYAMWQAKVLTLHSIRVCFHETLIL